jgi:hypothetical protein
MRFACYGTGRGHQPVSLGYVEAKSKSAAQGKAFDAWPRWTFRVLVIRYLEDIGPLGAKAKRRPG